MLEIFGFTVCVSPWVDPIIENVQKRFPKSKKKRIRIKWSKNKNNFVSVKKDRAIVDNARGIIWISQKNYDALNTQVDYYSHFSPVLPWEALIRQIEAGEHRKQLFQNTLFPKLYDTIRRR